LQKHDTATEENRWTQSTVQQTVVEIGFGDGINVEAREHHPMKCEKPISGENDDATVQTTKTRVARKPVFVHAPAAMPPHNANLADSDRFFAGWGL
jgi:hypothetical protein